MTFRAKWTDDMVALARQMRAAGAMWKEIDAALGVIHGASQGKLAWLDQTPEQREFRRQRVNARRRALYNGADKFVNYARPQVDVPPDTWAERERAMSAPRDLTSLLLGDPPPHRSALARRQAAEP